MTLQKTAAYSPTPEKIEDIKRRIVRHFDPVKIILFGSLANDGGDFDSDVDLLVVLDTIDDYHETTGLILDTLKGVGVPTDVIVATPLDLLSRERLVSDIVAWALRTGTPIYDRA